MRRAGFSILLSLALASICGFAFADCPSLNMSKGPDQVARQFLTGPGIILLFLGKIESEKFVGDFRRRYDFDADNSIDITYSVEEVYRGQAPSRLTLRTPFFCEACSYDDETELRDGLNSEVGRRVIVFAWEEKDHDGHLTTRVSGGCPASIDAWRSRENENDLVLALRRASRKE